MNAASRWSQGLQRAWLARGLVARLLLPLSGLFAAVSALRSWSYRLGLRATHALPVPVIVVGNLIVGGAGKTPTVIAIASLLQRRGFKPGIVSRGYGRAGDETLEVQADTPAGLCGDEPVMLRRRTGVPVIVGRDRVAAGRALLRAHPQIDIVLSDDGLQHLRLARDAQVIVFDERGAGNGWLLPAGPLRERLPAAVPPRTLVLYNAASPSTVLPGGMVQRSLAGVAALGAWRAGEPTSLAALDRLRARPLLAAAGVAQPQRFFDLLRQHGLQFDALPLPDHFDYAALPWPAGTADVVVTEKDAVKLDPSRLGTTRVWVAALDFALPAEFESALVSLLPPHPLSGTDHGNPTA